MRRAVPFAALLAVLGLLAAACGGGSPAAAPLADAASPSPVAFDFPTGDAVVVPPGYEAPRDRVDSTGAFLPVNGKPTLVFVDAIW